MKFKQKKVYDFNDLVNIIQILRSKEGCPWDREQTHESLKANTLEEVYEVIDAIDNNNIDNLKEELGDMLLHVVFHADIEREKEEFTINDVIHQLVTKLIRRHPHVFGDKVSKSSSEVIDSWEDIKKKEHNYISVGEELDNIPSALPALIKAYKVQKKVSRIGFDFNNIDDAFDKIYEELNELKEAINKGKKEAIIDEYGDILFSIVNISRFLEINPEICLTNSTKKFINRFKGIEMLAKEKEIDIFSASIEELDRLWENIKNEF